MAPHNLFLHSSLVLHTLAFQLQPFSDRGALRPHPTGRPRTPALPAGSVVDLEPADGAAPVVPQAARPLDRNGLYVPDKCVSTLRFLVPREEQIPFEHSWAERAERLADTPGLRYFHVGKRGADFMGPPLPDDEFNYQAYAVWESEEAHEAAGDWSAAGPAAGRSGEGDPADYDGLFALSVPPAESGVPATRSPAAAAADADPSKRLPREAFVASNRFGIRHGHEKDFEDMWASRDSSLADLPGFVNFLLLRRRGPSNDDGNNYVSYTTWDSQKAFNNWRESENFKKSHSNKSGGGEKKESPYVKMPKVVTFKNFLVVSAEDGM